MSIERGQFASHVDTNTEILRLREEMARKRALREIGGGSDVDMSSIDVTAGDGAEVELSDAPIRIGDFSRIILETESGSLYEIKKESESDGDGDGGEALERYTLLILRKNEDPVSFAVFPEIMMDQEIGSGGILTYKSENGQGHSSRIKSGKAFR